MARTRIAPTAVAFQTTLPPLDARGILEDLTTLRAVIAEASRRYAVALRNEAGGNPYAVAGEYPVCRSPREIYNLVAPEMAHLAQENLRVLCLNSKNQVIDVVDLYRGTLNSSPVRMAELFRQAIVSNAASIALVHNHPSGDPTPSPEDVRTTAEAVKAGQLLDIEVLDHIIIGRPVRNPVASSNCGYVSLKERGLGF